MIYVPDKENYECFVVRSEEIIRAYKTIPTNNSDVYYRDYYINADYYYNDGTQSFTQYSTIPVCLADDVITTSVYYRTDFDSILVVFLIMCIFCFYIPLKIFMRLFKRFN